MDTWNAYHTPSTYDEAIGLLQRYDGNARIIAGGTDLILDLQSGDDERPDAVVDVTALPHMDFIGEEEGAIVVGAGATHGSIADNDLILQHGTSLAEASAVVGGPQVRNVATIGGNLAHALPAADGTTGLLVLDAEVLIHGGTFGTAGSWVPLPGIFAGPGANTLGLDQFIGAVRFEKRGPNHGSAFDRIMRPQGVALPMLAAAAALSWDEKRGVVEDVAIAVGPSGPTPVRFAEAETFLSGKAPSADHVAATIELVQQRATFRTSPYRATREYRFEMVSVLIERVLSRALARAGYVGKPRGEGREVGDATT